MDTDKLTKNHLKSLSSDLGQAWDSPTNSRRGKPSPLSLASSAKPATSHPEQTVTASPAPSCPQEKGIVAPKTAATGLARNRTPLPSSNPDNKSATLSENGEMSSRGNQRRGTNRNSEHGEHGEELAMWKDIKDKLPGAVQAVNESTANVAAIRDQEKRMKEKGNATPEELNKLDNVLRKGVKDNEAASQSLTKLIEELKVLRAVQKAKEDQPEVNTSRTNVQRAKDVAVSSSLYDFDGAGDSPVPSPNPNISRRIGGSSKTDRGSVPPRDHSTPAAKAGSAEPQAGSAANASRSKQNFSKDDEVAFKPKPANNEQTDWILGIVQEVRGEGKSRRYRVLDADVDENGHQKDFRTSASSMILIPRNGTILPPLDNGKVVLALYPNTTTFYKAEVMGMDVDGKVNLKFEGEESSNTMQAVTRRHVVEYRG